MSLTAAQRNDNLVLRYYKQTDYGESPASTALQELRIRKEGFKLGKKTVKSQVLGNRQVKDIFKVGEDFSGSISGEFAHAEWEWAMEGIMASTFTTFTLTATDISFAAADSSINSVGAGFSSSVVAGQWIKVAGTASHNGLWYVATKSSTSKLILSDGVTSAGVTMTVANESAGASMTVTGKHLRQGTTLNSYTFERKNTDNATFDVWNSFVLDSVALNFKGESIVEIEVQGIGKVGDLNNSATFGSSSTAASTNVPMNATNNMLRIKEGSTVISDEMISASLMIKANARHRLSLGQATPQGAVQDTLEASSQCEFYFKDNARRQLFQDHTSGSFYYILKSSAAQYFIVTMKKIYYQDLSNSAEGQNADTLEKYQIDAVEDGTYAQTVCIDVL